MSQGDSSEQRPSRMHRVFARMSRPDPGELAMDEIRRLDAEVVGLREQLAAAEQLIGYIYELARSRKIGRIQAVIEEAGLPRSGSRDAYRALRSSNAKRIADLEERLAATEQERDEWKATCEVWEIGAGAEILTQDRDEALERAEVAVGRLEKAQAALRKISGMGRVKTGTGLGAAGDPRLELFSEVAEEALEETGS